MYVCVPCMQLPGEARRGQHIPWVLSQRVMSCHVGARNWAQNLWKSNQSHLLSSYIHLLQKKDNNNPACSQALFISFCCLLAGDLKSVLDVFLNMTEIEQLCERTQYIASLRNRPWISQILEYSPLPAARKKSFPSKDWVVFEYIKTFWGRNGI